MSTYKLTYFNARGIAEAIRMILIYSGKEFQDIRVDYSKWMNHLKNETPFGKLPLLEVDGKIYHQSMAICRYLGNETDLGGSNNEENLCIDMVADTFQELRATTGKYFLEQNEEVKMKMSTEILEETLPYYLTKFDKLICKNGGYFACGKLTWIDFYFTGYSETMESIYNDKVFDHYLNIKNLRKKLYSLPSIRDWILKRPITLY